MSQKIEKLLDDTGWQLLSELQKNARLTHTELGQRVNLTSAAVADRLRKMEEVGIIAGYNTKINLEKIGLPIQVSVRLTLIGGTSCEFASSKISEIPEILECHRTIGDDSLIIKAAASSNEHLTEILDKLSTYGTPETYLLRAEPMIREEITPDALGSAKK